MHTQRSVEERPQDGTKQEAEEQHYEQHQLPMLDVLLRWWARLPQEPPYKNEDSTARQQPDVRRKPRGVGHTDHCATVARRHAILEPARRCHDVGRDHRRGKDHRDDEEKGIPHKRNAVEPIGEAHVASRDEAAADAATNHEGDDEEEDLGQVTYVPLLHAEPRLGQIAGSVGHEEAKRVESHHVRHACREGHDGTHGADRAAQRVDLYCSFLYRYSDAPDHVQVAHLAGSPVRC
mmetsp:Transcript_19583/g.51924  ORF Transcript_19583/g.51924 Transcript_19583/m.51924 type:complete len:235 (-) Transcript_19583:418-1122(-)